MVLDKTVKTVEQKYPCQAVSDKPILLTINNNLVKQYLTSLSKLCDKNILVKWYLTRLLKLCNKKYFFQVVPDKTVKTVQQKCAILTALLQNTFIRRLS